MILENYNLVHYLYYMKKSAWLICLLSIVIALGIGFAGAFFTTPQIATWYATLVKPALNPPAWIFGPVWTLLYILMGVASYLIWEKRKQQGAKTFLIAYVVSLILNFLWSLVFFGGHQTLAAAVIVILLWGTIVGLIITAMKIDKLASYLLIPYLLWVSFATYLNIAIFLLN